MILYNHFSLIHSRSTKNISTKILSKTKDLTLSREKYNSFIESSLISSGKKNNTSFTKDKFNETFRKSKKL